MTCRNLVQTHASHGALAARLGLSLAVTCVALSSPVAWTEPATQAQHAVVQKTFNSPEAAVEALVSAAERHDVQALKEIVGPDGVDLVVTGDPVLDKSQSAEFAARAREKTQVLHDPENPGEVTLTVGAEDWPAPMPLVEDGGRWRFDAAAGREEVLLRRIGDNELNAIAMCRGYVEAQYEYASQKHDGAPVNQYAQRVISTPGRQDGLAWRDADGNWQGPVGEAVAQFIADGYSERYEPFYGYYFKILKGQGPAAPMGEMDFLVKGVMIGGFGLVAAPADYGVTGVKTFIVSHSGVVYEKDLGPETLEQFRAMDRYDPDPTWEPVPEH